MCKHFGLAFLSELISEDSSRVPQGHRHQESLLGCCCLFVCFSRAALQGVELLQFNYSPDGGHLGCFQFGTIVNIAATNIHIQDFV